MQLKLRTDRIIKGSPKAVLNAPVSVGGTSLGVYSNTGFAGTNKYVLVGNPGFLDAEIVTFTSVTGGTIITVGALKYDHPQGTPVYLIQANKVAFSYCSTLTGAFAYVPTGVIAADAVDIMADNEFTTYTDNTNSAGYGKAIFYNSGAAATYGSAYEIIRYDGDEHTSRGFVKQLALEEMYATIDGQVITEDYLNRQVVQADLRFREEKLQWKEDTNELVIPTVLGQTRYDLRTYIKEAKNIYSIQFAKILNQDMDLVTYDVFKERLGSAVSTTLAANIVLLPLDVTVTVADASDLATEGTITVGSDTLSYTSKNNTTNVLSGVTGITMAHTLGEEVWQNNATDKPYMATVFDGYLYTYPVINATEDLYNICLVYNKQYTNITLDSDELAFPFYLYVTFLKTKIGERTGDKDLVVLKQDFDRDLAKHKFKDFSTTEHRFTPDPRMVLYSSSRRGSLQ
jgi:hypothetical protein